MPNEIPVAKRGQLQRDNTAEFPVTEHHSVLVLNPKRKLYHVPADPNSGDFNEPPAQLEIEHQSYRKVLSLAGEALTPDGTPAFASHSAFSILPIRSEPNAVFADCYLINALRLKPVNIWTAAELNDHPDVQAQALEGTTTLVGRVLLATAKGELLDVTLTEDGGATPTAAVQRLGAEELRANPELWRMLRNGCVVGHAALSGQVPLVPLVNLASFAQSEPAPRNPTQPNEELQHAGTFDFKWPADRVIKVVLLPPTLSASEGVDLEVATAAMQLVRDFAKQWTKGTSVSFEFQDAIVDGEGDSRKLQRPIDYDLLVDLDPLPRTLPAVHHRGKEIRGKRVISFTMSELGTYATRRPLKEPTMYIGCPKGLKNESGAAFASSREYFESKAFKYVILHEFGHALGLPHLHQHPELRANEVFDPPAQVSRLIAQHLGLVMDANFLEEHFLLRWPGGKTFSDFVPVAGKTPAELARESVMMGLPIQAILRDVNTTALEYHTELGALDKQWILQLYPRPIP